MRSAFLFFALLTTLHLVHADHAQKETTQYVFGTPKTDTIPVEQKLPRSRRSVSLTHVNNLKSAVKNVRNDAKDRPDVKKRVRFFVHEGGDINLIDNQGNDYISTDDEEKEDDKGYHFGSPSALPSPHAESSAVTTGRSSPPPRSASWSATARQRQERALFDAAVHREHRPAPRQGMDFGGRSISSSTMEYKRQIVSQIRMTESKIEFLLEMIAEQKQERCEAAKYNLMRMKLIDYRQQSRIWNARIRLLKHELSRQEDELEYYEHELIMVQRRLQSAIRQSQRSPISMSH